jgi:hypothetical protein
MSGKGFGRTKILSQPGGNEESQKKISARIVVS